MRTGPLFRGGGRGAQARILAGRQGQQYCRVGAALSSSSSSLPSSSVFPVLVLILVLLLVLVLVVSSCLWGPGPPAASEVRVLPRLVFPDRPHRTQLLFC